MIQDTLNELERMLEKEIQKVTNKNDITPTELDSMTKALCLLEHIQCYREGGYSGYIYDPNQPVMDGRSYAPRGRYNIRYSGDHYPNDRRMMYSGHSLKDRMVAKLEEMYDDVKNDHERQMLDTWMRRLTSD